MKIALLGDVSLNGKFDFSNYSDALQRVEFIKKVVADCDFVIANLESPLTDKKRTAACKGAYLRSGTKSKEILSYLGITHVTIANNHLFDYGKKGVQDTIDSLNSIGIKYVGLNNSPEFLIKDNDRVIVDGFCCYSANALKYGQKIGKIKTLSHNNLQYFLGIAQQERCLPIASVHFGLEHVHYPSLEHVKLFRDLAGKYKYILHGHHPHAIQGEEMINDSALFYSLGNLCFDDIEKTAMHEVIPQTEESLKSYIVKLDIQGTKVVNVEKTGDFLNDHRMSAQHDIIIEEVIKYSKPLEENIEGLDDLRKHDLILHKPKRNKSKFAFIFSRLNRRYLIAFFRGKIYAKKYNKVMKSEKENHG